MDANAHGEQPQNEKRWSDFATRVAVGIAIMSVLGALAGYRASLVGIDAEDLSRKLVEERMQVEAEQLQVDEKIQRDVSLYARYQEHIMSAHVLEDQARDAYRRGRSDSGEALDMQAQAELAVARAMTPFFRVQDPSFGDTPGVVTYNREIAVARQQFSNEILRTVHPDITQGSVERKHAENLHLEFVAALFIGSVFLLTIAEFGPQAVRVAFVQAGAAAAIGGGVYWTLVELGLLR